MIDTMNPYAPGLIDRSSLIQRAGSYVLSDVGTGLQVAQQYLSAGAAVAVCLMMIQADAVTIAHIVELVAHTGLHPSAKLHSASIAHIRFPVDLVIAQAFFQHVHIKYRIVRHKQTA